MQSIAFINPVHYQSSTASITTSVTSNKRTESITEMAKLDHIHSARLGSARRARVCGTVFPLYQPLNRWTRVQLFMLVNSSLDYPCGINVLITPCIAHGPWDFTEEQMGPKPKYSNNLHQIPRHM